VKCYTWSIALYGAENWTLRKVEQRYLLGFKMWCWKSMKIMIWIDRLKNEEVFHSQVGTEHAAYTKTKGGEMDFHILRKKCLIEGKRGRTDKQLLDDLKGARRYWKLKADALDPTLRRTLFGRGYGPVLRQTM
jgi:hypothetical protein